MWALWPSGAGPAAPANEYELHRVTWDGQLNGFPALSPDGTLLAFASDRAGNGDLDIWVKQVNGGTLVRVTDDPEDEILPSFSADGSQLLYSRAGEGVYTVPTLGGEPYLVAAGAFAPAFAPDGKQVTYIKSGGLYVSPVSMGEPKLLLGDMRSSGQPLWTPDGKHVLFAGRRAEGEADWWAVPVDGSEPRSLGARDFYQKSGREPVVGMGWTWDGDSIVFENGNAELARIGFDRGALKVQGPEQLLTVGAGLEVSPTSSKEGVIAFMDAWQRRDIWELPMGVASIPSRITTAESFDTSGDVSPDGRRLVYISNRWNQQDIWTVNLRTGQETNLTSDDAEQQNPILSRDGERVAYLVREDDKAPLYVRPYSGGFGKRVCEDCGIPTDWSPDGRKLLFNRRETQSVQVLDIASGETSDLLAAENCHARLARYSPGGRSGRVRPQLRPGRGRPLHRQTGRRRASAARFMDRSHGRPRRLLSGLEPEGRPHLLRLAPPRYARHLVSRAKPRDARADGRARSGTPLPARALFPGPRSRLGAAALHRRRPAVLLPQRSWRRGVDDDAERPQLRRARTSMEKRYALSRDRVKPLAERRGRCLASDRILVDGKRVGYMYREDPEDDGDSGWSFLAGDESDEYVNDPANLAFYDVNTIANYDPEIIPFLDAPPGTAFARDLASGQLQLDRMPDEDVPAVIH